MALRKNLLLTPPNLGFVHFYARRKRFQDMEDDRKHNDLGETPAPAWSTNKWPTSGYRPTSGYNRGIFICGISYLIMTIMVTAKWSFRRHTAMDGAALFPTDNLDTRKLGVVVPTHPGDLEEAVEALSSWPNVCSAVSLHRMELVLYYSGRRGDGVWSEQAISTVKKTGGRCFERTKVVFADLDKEVTGPSAWLALL